MADEIEKVGGEAEGRRVLLGFLVMFGLLLLVAGFSYYIIDSSSNTFTNYREMARDANLAGRVQANMLMVRMNVKDFIITGSNKDLKEYSDYYRRMSVRKPWIGPVACYQKAIPVAWQTFSRRWSLKKLVKLLAKWS